MVQDTRDPADLRFRPRCFGQECRRQALAVGLLTLLVSTLAGFGLFLIPSRTHAQTSPDLGWLGVSIMDVSEELADRLAATFGPAEGTGALVMEVLRGGPAERSSLKRGDVIVKLDGQPIWDVRQLQRTIRSQPVNRRVVLTVLRESSRETVPLSIGAMPPEARAQLAGERFGFLVREEDGRDPRPAERAPTGRILVAFVEADSPASRAGLRPQDAVLQANDLPVLTLADFERALRRSDRTVSLLVERRGTQTRLALTLELHRQ